MMQTITVEIINKKGLHARAAAKFVKLVASFPAQVTVTKLTPANEAELPAVTGSSILGLLMLGAEAGSHLHIDAQGDQAQLVLEGLKELVENKFGEAE